MHINIIIYEMKELNLFLIRFKIFKQVCLILQNVIANDLTIIEIKNFFENFFYSHVSIYMH